MTLMIKRFYCFDWIFKILRRDKIILLGLAKSSDANTKNVLKRVLIQFRDHIFDVFIIIN